MIYLDSYSSPMGKMTMAATEAGLLGLWFDGQKYDRAGLTETVTAEGEMPVLAETRQWLDCYFRGETPGFLPPLVLTGSPFRRLVLEILLTVPYGTTTTYGAIAKEASARLGRERVSAQAVGGAVGHNPISVVVPCHRVVGANGSLTGYAGGIERKCWLLEHEGISLQKAGLTIPERGTAL